MYRPVRPAGIKGSKTELSGNEPIEVKSAANLQGAKRIAVDNAHGSRRNRPNAGNEC